VEEPADYEFLVGHDTPRPGSLLKALKADARSPQVLRYWAAGGGVLAIGLAAAWVGFQVGIELLTVAGFALAGAAAWWLAFLIRLFVAAVAKLRDGPLLLGEIRILRSATLARGYSTAIAWLPDGRHILVAVLAAPAAAVLARDGRAEVLILAAPDERHGVVVGIRAAAGNQAGPGPPASTEGGQRPTVQ
jgi:hypothetical protein